MSILEQSNNPILVEGHLHSISPVKVDLAYNPIIHRFDQQFFSFGSCFARNIVNVLYKSGFNTFYQVEGCSHWSSKSLLSLLQVWSSEREYAENDLYHFTENTSVMSLYHSRLYARGDTETKAIFDKMKKLDSIANEKLQKAEIILLTLCNATYIRDKITGKPICYNTGFPLSQADMIFPECEEILEDLSEIYKILKRLCSIDFKLIITISPQRFSWEKTPDILHTSLGKAKLRVAVDKFKAKQSRENSGIEYFPSYEITVDELRAFEMFNFKGTHVLVPQTSNYIANRFLISHCDQNVRDTLDFFVKEVSEKLPQELYRYEPVSIKTYLDYITESLKMYKKLTNCRYLVQRTIEILRNHSVFEYADELSNILANEH